MNKTQQALAKAALKAEDSCLHDKAEKVWAKRIENQKAVYPISIQNAL